MDCRDEMAIYGAPHHKMMIDEKKMEGTIILENEEGEEEEISFPVVFSVCGTCAGKGSYVNPSIDSNGISSDEWDNDWSEDEREDYMNGAYDIQCEECHRQRVIPVIDESNLSPDQKKNLVRYNERLESIAESNAICRAEREAGA